MDQAPKDEGRGALVALPKDQWGTFLEVSPIKTIHALTCSSKGMQSFMQPLLEAYRPKLSPFRSGPVLITPGSSIMSLRDEENSLFSNPQTTYLMALGALQQVMKNPMIPGSNPPEFLSHFGSNRCLKLTHESGDGQHIAAAPDFGPSLHETCVVFKPVENRFVASFSAQIYLYSDDPDSQLYNLEIGEACRKVHPFFQPGRNQDLYPAQIRDLNKYPEGTREYAEYMEPTDHNLKAVQTCNFTIQLQDKAPNHQ
jgi:hypothetical protein